MANKAHAVASKTIVVASGNPGKVREFARYFGSLGYHVKSLKDFPELGPVEEDGATFFDNALKKAKSAAVQLKLPVLADDSGLEVARLDGAPGVYSARFAGEHADDAANNRKLIEELKKKPLLNASETPVQLSEARYVCVLVLYDPENDGIMHAEGVWEGAIIEQPQGENGFGYDPYFYLPQLGKTAAELDPDEKNKLSHRGIALQKLAAAIKARMN